MNLIYKIKRRFNQKFRPWSSNYWDNRYVGGGNSGDGSYGKLALFKNKVISEFCKENNLTNIIEFGSGDGNQASLLQSKIELLGLDISAEAIKVCKEKFRDNTSLKFLLFSGRKGFCKKHHLSAPLTLSLDVIYHLIEDQVFEDYIHELFTASTKFVMIYSSDKEMESGVQHVRHRKFTDYVATQFPSFQLIKRIPNEYSEERQLEESSFADFYIYHRSQ